MTTLDGGGAAGGVLLDMAATRGYHLTKSPPFLKIAGVAKSPENYEKQSSRKYFCIFDQPSKDMLNSTDILSGVGSECSCIPWHYIFPPLILLVPGNWMMKITER